jgi:hypothetical protein
VESAILVVERVSRTQPAFYRHNFVVLGTKRSEVMDNLPGGISGVAELVEARVEKFNHGPYKGQPHVRLVGKIIIPADCLSLKTILICPLCPSFDKSLGENVHLCINELRKLGVEANNIDDEEGLRTALVALEASHPHFRFSTRESLPTKHFPSRVYTIWHGVVKNTTTMESFRKIEERQTTITFPEHKCGLTLEHNQHKNYYQSLLVWEEGLKSTGCGLGWLDDNERKLAIEYDSVWVLQWYPETPVGFHRLAAYNLQRLLKEAKEIA